MLKRFTTWLRALFGQGPRRTNPADFDPNTGEFTLPTPEKLAAQLRIRERAREDAECGLPASKDMGPAGTQIMIIQYARNRAIENCAAARRVIAEYEERIVNADVRPELGSLK